MILSDFTVTPTLREVIGNEAQVFSCELIQTLWSGYGHLVRLELAQSHLSSVIVKAIQLPDEVPASHPKGWNTQLSHQRKLQSYQVEFSWYQEFVSTMPSGWAPQCFSAHKYQSHLELILEDLKLLERARVVKTATEMEIKSVLKWLAQFHAFWLGANTNGLWKQGTYWHLATRPDEWQAMQDERFKQAAHIIDEKLNECPYQTLVHGDAKLANFCFNKQGSAVSAVDFQYVGGGVGVKDVALFFTTTLDFSTADINVAGYLDYYFIQLHSAIEHFKPEINANRVCEEWRALFGLAWADYQRFLLGWSPDHSRINAFTSKLTQQALDDFQL
ncbi:aminoglycoside phosphotransferase family protein [Vibrio mediterranei]|uniref:aminoglycoside phosphotransferase family protein n=1 Tax=Vibrio mediterranei TaxID=689 RepID=UPI001EFED1FA|nr:aminoglycoside phosphotransferase family protein [Vibrio mediterranei]MCG9627873.1 aminoglycoside phosphotransferase family protein [Vibrio mediterranei]